MAGRTRSLTLLAGLVAAGFAAAIATAAPGDPKLSVKPADQAHARAVLLRKAELPGKGWIAAPVDFGRANPLCLVKHYSLGKLTATGQAGVEFGRRVDSGTFLVDSAARVFRTAAEARTAATIRSKLGVGKCLGAALASEAPNGSFATSSAKAFSISGLALPAKGFTITVDVISGQQRSTLTAVVLDFRRGRTVNELNVLTIGKGWSSASLRSVAAVLARRTAR